MDQPDPLLDRGLPNWLRVAAGQLDDLARRTRGLVEDLAPPASGAPLEEARAFATELEVRAAAYLAWVDSNCFPTIAAGQRDRYRTAANRLLTSARRLGAATERRRVDELIERSAEALVQSAELFGRASAAVMLDV